MSDAIRNALAAQEQAEQQERQRAGILSVVPVGIQIAMPQHVNLSGNSDTVFVVGMRDGSVNGHGQIVPFPSPVVAMALPIELARRMNERLTELLARVPAKNPNVDGPETRQ